MRLTAWYLVILALGFGVFGLGSWYGIRAGIFHTVDEELEERVRSVGAFLELQDATQGPEYLAGELREHAGLTGAGGMLRVRDQEGRWLLGPAGLEPADGTVRVMTSSVTARGRKYEVQAGRDIREFFEALEVFRDQLWWLVPALLLMAGCGGYWLSGRALRPVRDLIEATEAIRIQNLGGRLAVPESGDEIAGLAQTLNRMLTRLDESVRRISRFTADASHELRAPVAVIRTTAELAAQGERNAAESRDDMASILNEAERVSRLIDNLLRLARADAGEAGVAREVFDLGAALRAAASQCGPLAEQRKVRLSCHISDAIPVLGDPEALHRLFYILVENAVKYTPEGGRAEVLAEGGEKEICLRVRDTGIGIAAEDLPLIFDRFWRADKVRSREAGGVGLGLAIARSIAEAHGLEIQAESEPGKGSCFSVRVPLVDIRR